MIYHPEYKGVRLDIYAKNEIHTHYNVEMQAVRKEALGKRFRYYTSQMDRLPDVWYRYRTNKSDKTCLNQVRKDVQKTATISIFSTFF